jgi:iron complex transport system substrate-binding protein
MKKTKLFALIIAAVLSIMVLLGCSAPNTAGASSAASVSSASSAAASAPASSSAPSASNTTSAPAAVPSFTDKTATDFAGTTLSVDKPANTVMCIHPIFTMLALRLAPDKVISVDKVFTTQYVSGSGQDALLKNLNPDHIKTLPVTNTGVMSPLDPEQVLGLNPDVIVTLDKDPNAAKLKDETKKPFVIVSKNTLQNYSASMRIMGFVLGNTTEANQMADYWDKTIASISSKTDPVATKDRPNVYHCASGSILATVGKDTIMASVVRIAGGNNLGDTISDVSNGKNESITVSMDQILKWNPDVVVANTAAQYKEIMSSPDWQSVNAVKDGRVYCQLKYAQVDGLTTLPGLLWYNAILSAKSGAANLDSYYNEAPNFFKLFYKYDVSKDELTISR